MAMLSMKKEKHEISLEEVVTPCSFSFVIIRLKYQFSTQCSRRACGAVTSQEYLKMFPRTIFNSLADVLLQSNSKRTFALWRSIWGTYQAAPSYPLVLPHTHAYADELANAPRYHLPIQWEH